MQNPIKVTYKSTNNVYRANQFISEIQQYPIFGADFEVALKFSDDEVHSFKRELEGNPPKAREIELKAALKATALSHPSYTVLTHCSIGVSESEAYVFVLDNPKITQRVLYFLTNTEQTQVWHNATFDFQHIYYRIGKFPLVYEDTQLLAKTILNHADPQQALTGLKELAGKWYGAWGISEDLFTLAQMYDPKMLLYAATDSCATLKLWHSINDYIETNPTF